MKILSIGNSFSRDAHRYLFGIAKHAGVACKTANLYIGGCSLRTHYLNMLEDRASYELDFNGQPTGFKVSIRQALASDDWDVITLQQASHFSGDFATYTPYIAALADFVRKYCPHAKLMIHQTWAYEADSDKLRALSVFATPTDMMHAVRESYARAAETIHADGIIPCGEAMLRATALGIEKIHRDTFHAAYGVGRYLLGLCWFATLTGRDITKDAFSDFDMPVTEEERSIAIRAVKEVLENA